MANLFGALAGVLLLASWGGLAQASKKASSAGLEPLWTEAKQRRVRHERSEIASVAHRAMPAVVSITTRQTPAASGYGEPQKGLGSGFLIHPDGYILTSSHVIEEAHEIKVTLERPGEGFEDHLARVVGRDEQTDIALLKIDAGRRLPVLQLSSATKVDVADWVVVIGNPFGLAHSVTVGVVSYKGRTDVTPNGRSGYFDYLQTDAPINPGNSGGPILDLHGEVVAIANAVNVAGQGIGFAVPIDIAKEILPQLKKHGSVQRGWMGISVQDITPEIAEVFGERTFSGVMVSEVQGGSPASVAGLQVGDVIIGVGKSRIERAHALRWKVATSEIGRKVELSVRREGKPQKVLVMLQEAPPELRAEKKAEEAQDSAAPAFLPIGVTVSEVDLTASVRAGLARPFGALILEVAPGSAIATSGLEPGDVVLKVNSIEITSRQQFVDVLDALASGSLARLFVRRGQQTMPFTVLKP